VTPLVPRVAVLAARHDLPASVVAGIDQSLRAEAAEDRLDEVLEELDRIRAETGWPPLASPIGQVLASQAIINVLSASRYLVVLDEVRSLVTGAFGTPPAPIDPALDRVVQLTADPESEEDITPPLDEVRELAGDFATSEEELLLLGLFGEDAERLLRGIRGRGRRDAEPAGANEQRTQRIREIVRIVEDSGIGEVTIEEDGMKISVRSTPDLLAGGEASGDAPLAVPEPEQPVTTAISGTLVRVESPMVGTFYRAGQPGAPPFVEVGDVVAPGQTLCILEAMKLMNEVKADVEGVVRGIHAENASPVEFGQLLFELEPLVGRPTL
jgi:oxaloacetate decarboxylase alpha subunit